MLLGFDGIPLCAPKTGIGHYTFELARELALLLPADELRLLSPHPFSYPSDPADDARWPENLHAVRPHVRRWERFWFAVGLPRYLRRTGITLFHGTNYEIPLGWRGTKILTVHDLSLFRYAHTHERRLVWRARWRWPLMLRAADAIITPTEYIRRELLDHFKLSPARVTAIPEAPRPQFQPLDAAQTTATRQRLGVTDDFILFVGTVEPRKNLATLVRAYHELLQHTDLRPQLVIAGQKGWLTEKFFAELRMSAVADRVHFTGYISESDLQALYASCRVFVYPSLYEGFGLPPLEAMACGAPVIASRIGSHTEILHDAACLVAPESVSELTATLVNLLTDEGNRQELSDKGRRRAAEFTWARAAQRTLEVYCAICTRLRFAIE